MNQKIALKYANSVYFENNNQYIIENNTDLAASFAAEMVQLGYIPTNGLMEAMTKLPRDVTVSVFSEVITSLKEMKGADVNYVPFYPNFPQQVMEASDAELFINAIVHYWSGGALRPVYDVLPREVAFEDVKLKKIGRVDTYEFFNIFTRLVSSNDSLTATDKEVVEWFLTNHLADCSVPDEISYKETMCLVAGYFLKSGVSVHYLNKFVKTTTDVLRVATYLSGGDVSLADNTKFKSLPRKTRRTLVGLLEEVINIEDVNRHRNKWIKLFHNLHVGEYSPALYNVAKLVRENKKIETFNGQVQAAIDSQDNVRAVNLLVTRPSEFARRLDHLLRTSTVIAKDFVANSFIDVINEVPTRILLQVKGALRLRSRAVNRRVVFPKGNVQHATILRDNLDAIPAAYINDIVGEIDEVLQDRFSELGELGKVWVDPELAGCPIPTQMRSMSEGTFQVARGSRLPVGDKKTIRFFIYWVGRDIDLSATMHDENFKRIGHVSYTRLRSDDYQACHSGDITRAPNGASEFIDIDIDGALKSGARYIGMNVLVFAGPTFAEHEKVYAGWMTRDHVQSNEIYDPKTVAQKVDLKSESKNCVPVMFDLKERKAIWTDLSTPRNEHYWGNNVESNRASIEQTMEAIADTSRKVSLYELFELHGKVRGEIVENKEDADTVFSLYEGDVTPYDLSVINSEYVV